MTIDQLKKEAREKYLEHQKYADLWFSVDPMERDREYFLSLIEKATLAEQQRIRSLLPERKEAHQHWNGAFIVSDNYEGGFNHCLEEITKVIGKEQ